MASQHVLFLNELEGKKACWQQEKVLQLVIDYLAAV